MFCSLSCTFVNKKYLSYKKNEVTGMYGTLFFNQSISIFLLTCALLHRSSSLARSGQTLGIRRRAGPGRPSSIHYQALAEPRNYGLCTSLEASTQPLFANFSLQASALPFLPFFQITGSIRLTVEVHLKIKIIKQ